MLLTATPSLFPHQRMELHRLLTSAIGNTTPTSDTVPRYMVEDCVFHNLEREAFSTWVQGNIKFYLTQKSYGFLNYLDPVMEQPGECFFHLSNCMIPYLVNYTDTTQHQDHEVIGMALRPLKYETRRVSDKTNVANERSEHCPYILSKGMRVSMLIYPNEMKGWYAGQWLATSHYEEFVKQATERVEQRKQRIARLSRYELVLEIRTDCTQDWETLSEQDCHRCTVLETNQPLILEKAWLSGQGRLSKYQRLLVLANLFDETTGEWEQQVWTKFMQIKDAPAFLPPFDLDIDLTRDIPR